MEWVQMGTKGYFALWLELAKTRGEITVEEIEAATSANRNIIKLHLKKLEGRGARYTIK